MEVFIIQSYPFGEMAEGKKQPIYELSQPEIGTRKHKKMKKVGQNGGYLKKHANFARRIAERLAFRQLLLQTIKTAVL